MSDQPESDILADPVPRTACPQCGTIVDSSEAAPFSAIQCSQCGAKFAAPGRLGDFVLLKALGRGAMGATYKALEKGLKRFVAVKVMRSDLGADRQRVDGFFAEARAVASLEHPNAARLYSLGQEKGQPYLVMELIKGKAMDRAFGPDAPMGEDRVLEIALGVAKALEAAAKIGLVHGDVKPANIMLDERGTPKLVDFGVARFGGGPAGEEFMGTPYYVSPEQVRRQGADFRSDIYSLGATMFHALTGRPPFPGTSIHEVLDARLAGPAPDLQSIDLMLHPRTAAVVARMLAADPAGRHQSYRELLEDLQQAYFQVTGLHTPEMQSIVGRPEIPLAAPVSASRTWLFVAGGVAALLAAALGAWAIWLRGGSGPATGPAGPLAYAASPTFQPPPRTITAPTAVEIRCETPGAEVRYTLDGRDPNESSAIYEAAVSVPPGATLKARAYEAGHRPSAVAAGTYSGDSTALAEVVRLRTEALKAWQRVQMLDSGQGFRARLEEGDTHHTNGEELYAREAYGQARGAYEKLLALSKELEALDARRTAARSAREAVEATEQALRDADVKAGPNPPWRPLREAAERAFADGRFDEAARLWQQADAKARASALEEAAKARREWAAALAKADAAALGKDAPGRWREAQSARAAAEQADARADHPAAARLYRQARRLLGEARDAAQKNRAERLLDQHLQRAEDLLKRGQLRLALAEVEQALKLAPSSRTATDIRKRILEREGIVIDLSRGRKMTFLWVPPGTFVMGSPEGEGSAVAEKPHEVEITRPFYLSRYEVTRKDFWTFAKGESQYETDAEREKRAFALHGGKWVKGAEIRWDKPGFKQGDDDPVTCVTWADADRFCKWLSGRIRRTVRLPTEAEWEYACRAGSKTRFSFGDDEALLHRHGNFADASAAALVRHDKTQDDGHDTTTKVGSYRPNAWGLSDLHGNVAEWCADRYGAYPAGPVKDPQGPDRGMYRVVRGGSWDKLPHQCRSAYRSRLPEDYRAGFLGFRVVIEAGEAAGERRGEGNRSRGD